MRHIYFNISEFLCQRYFSPLLWTLYTNWQLVVKIKLTNGYKMFSKKGVKIMETIKERLSEEIKNCGLTTIELAKRIGVTPEMITQYKTTKKMPKLDTFAKICKELDVSADEILGLKVWNKSIKSQHKKTEVWKRLSQIKVRQRRNQVITPSQSTTT